MTDDEASSGRSTVPILELAFAEAGVNLTGTKAKFGELSKPFPLTVTNKAGEEIPCGIPDAVLERFATENFNQSTIQSLVYRMLREWEQGH